MGPPLIWLTVGITSLGAGLVCARGSRFRWRDFGAALGGMLEQVGMMLVFVACNVVVGLTIVTVARVVGHTHMSPYDIGDAVVLVFSVLQGLVFQSWWTATPRPRLSESGSPALSSEPDR